MESKKWYTSKTLWTNALAVIAAVAQGLSGRTILAPEDQMVILGLVNLVLRVVTKEPIN